MEAIMDYLAEHEPEAINAARRAYLCFEPYGEDAQAYAWRTTLVPDSCEDAVIDLLTAIREQIEYRPSDPEAALNAEQNAWVMVEAERYYRTMVRGGAASWNVRDYHMADTLERLMDHHGRGSKAVVWEHNTHIGDARATDMSNVGMVNVGQLVRERHEADGVVLVGFGSHRGRVIASRQWGAPLEHMPLPRAKSGSWEDILHRSGAHLTGSGDKLLLSDDLRAVEATMQERGHRAVGVVYHPERESGNYVSTVLPERYDAFLYFEETGALHPLPVEADTGQPPETYPWGV